VKAAVVGGGVFGCTIAVDLARAGADVTLYERHRDVLMGASRAHQGRVHRGYHYPRDPNAADLGDRAAEFEARFGQCLLGTRQYYLVAADSDAEAYEKFVHDVGLPWRPATLPLIHDGGVGACIGVAERLVDTDRLRETLLADLHGAGVQVRRGAVADIEALAGECDAVVDATYGRHWPEPLRYEVCETVLVQLGAGYRGQGFVVMDGEYCSLDPRGRRHMLYDVAHSVHAVNEIPDHLAGLIDSGLVYSTHSHIEAMLDSARRFLHLGNPVYSGSYFTVRAVLPDDGTDARPTLIRTDGNVIRVLAGKLAAAPWAARQVVEEVR
jgi:glycine/D-amino acid oxidase-like deaminating enzyme